MLQFQCVFQVPNGFRIGRVLNGSLSGLLQVSYCWFYKSCLQQMMGHELRLLLDCFRKLFFEDISNSIVKLLALAAQQTFISRILHQCVLKNEGGIRSFTSLKNKLRVDELRESRL